MHFIVTSEDDKKLDTDKLTARLREMAAVLAISQANEKRNIDDFLTQLGVADNLTVIDQEDNTSSQSDRNNCPKCKQGKLQQHHRTFLDKVTLVKKKYVCGYCADGVYIRRFNGN